MKSLNIIVKESMRVNEDICLELLLDNGFNTTENDTTNFACFSDKALCESTLAWKNMWLGRGWNTDQKGLRHQNKIQDSGIKTYM